MKILFVGNNKTERCGVAEFGRHAVAALRKIGHEVDEWQEIEQWRPPHDVAFLNWHAGTLGDQTAFLKAVEQWEPNALKSAYLHESSPAWNEPQHRPPLLDQVDVAFVDHPSVDGASYFRTPVWDVVPAGSKHHSYFFRPWIGSSGIRGEGTAAIREVCKKEDWLYSESAPEWLSPQEEVNRLASCWINVAWYGSGFGGQASAMGALIAAGQPILINSNRMLETWREFAESGGWGEVPRLSQLYLDDDLEAGLLEILADIRDGKARRPTWLREAYSWPKQAKRMVGEWERRLR